MLNYQCLKFTRIIQVPCIFVSLFFRQLAPIVHRVQNLVIKFLQLSSDLAGNMYCVLLFLCLVLEIHLQAVTATSASSPNPKYETIRAHRRKGWQVCPASTFIYAIAIDKKVFPEQIQLRCDSYGKEAGVTIQKSNDTRFGDILPCQGYAVGLQTQIDPATGQVVNLGLFCLNTTGELELTIDRNRRRFSGGEWTIPQMCAEGKYMCGTNFGLSKNLNETGMTNLSIKCCSHDYEEEYDNPKSTSNLQAKGHVIQSEYVETRRKTQVIDFLNNLDSPYWYGWTFCPPTHYFMGMKLNPNTGGLRITCRSTTAPLETVEIETGLPPGDSDYGDEALCDGVVIGFQVELLADRIKTLRLFCSAVLGNDRVSSIEFTFGEMDDFNGTRNATWQQEKLCGEQEAICGYKVVDARVFQGPKALKFKCCHVPEVSELCIPRDKYELVTECDGTEALASTTCTYTRTVGFTKEVSLSEQEKEEEMLHENLRMTTGRSASFGLQDSINQIHSKSGTSSSSTSQADTLNSEISHLTTNSSADTSSKSYTQTNANSSKTSSSRTDGLHASSHSSKTISKSKSDELDQSKGESSQHGSHSTFGKVNSENIETTRLESKGKSDTLTENESKTHSENIGRSRSTSDTQSNTDSTSDSSQDSINTGRSDSQGSSSTNGRSYGLSVGVDIQIPIKAVTLSVGAAYNFKRGYQNTRHNSRSGQTSQGKTHGQGSTSSFSRGTSNQETSSENEGSSRSSSEQQARRRSLQTGVKASFFAGTEQHASNSYQVNTQEALQNGSSWSESKGREESEQFQGENNTEIVEGSSAENSGSHSIQDTVDRSQQQSSGYSTGTQSTRNYESEIKKANTNSKQLTHQTGTKQNAEKTRRLTQGTSSDFTTTYNWMATDIGAWNSETRVQVRLEVPPGVRTKLYQVVGHCSFYRVRTSAFKRVDTRLEPEAPLSECYEEVGYYYDKYQKCNMKRNSTSDEMLDSFNLIAAA